MSVEQSIFRRSLDQKKRVLVEAVDAGNLKTFKKIRRDFHLVCGQPEEFGGAQNYLEVEALKAIAKHKSWRITHAEIIKELNLSHGTKLSALEENYGSSSRSIIMTAIVLEEGICSLLRAGEADFLIEVLRGVIRHNVEKSPALVLRRLFEAEPGQGIFDAEKIDGDLRQLLNAQIIKAVERNLNEGPCEANLAVILTLFKIAIECGYDLEIEKRSCLGKVLEWRIKSNDWRDCDGEPDRDAFQTLDTLIRELLWAGAMVRPGEITKEEERCLHRLQSQVNAGMTQLCSGFVAEASGLPTSVAQIVSEYVGLFAVSRRILRSEELSPAISCYNGLIGDEGIRR